MKSKLFFLVLFIAIYINSYSQSYLNPNIYDENGQYLKETAPPINQANIFDLGINFLGNKVYARGTLEGYSSFQNGLGIWSFARYSQAVIKDEWRVKGYNIRNDFNLAVSAALSYDFAGPRYSWIKTFLGLYYQSGQMYFGPIAGFYITENKVEFKAFGVYPLTCAYKDSYSEEELALSPLFGNPVYISDFDPNTWYRVSLKYNLTKKLKIGILSERFYGTNLSAEYDLSTSWRDMDKLYVKAMSGRDFEFKHNTFFMGLVLEL